MQAPEITITAERVADQPNPMQRMALGLSEHDVLYTLTVVCPHATTPVTAALCARHMDSGQPIEDRAGSWDMVLEKTIDQLRAAWPQRATCACSDPHWMRHGPPHSAEPNQAVAVMGNGAHVRYSAN